MRQKKNVKITLEEVTDYFRWFLIPQELVPINKKSKN